MANVLVFSFMAFAAPLSSIEKVTSLLFSQNISLGVALRFEVSFFVLPS